MKTVDKWLLGPSCIVEANTRLPDAPYTRVLASITWHFWIMKKQDFKNIRRMCLSLCIIILDFAIASISALYSSVLNRYTRDFD